MKTYEFSGHAGVRNDLSLERFKREDLSIGTNIDVDDTGKIYRREGTTQVMSGSYHSLYRAFDTTLIVESGVMKRVSDTWTKTDVCPVAGERVSYAPAYNEIFWVDGLQAGIVRGGQNRRWGMAVPAAPVVSTGVGDLAAGTYLVTVVHVDYDNKESGAAELVSVTVPDNSSLNVMLTASTDPKVRFQRVYISALNGELPYLAAEVMNTSQPVTFSSAPPTAIPIRTLYAGPPPAGRSVWIAHGRAWVADGNFLWYSRPYEFELFDRRNGYIGFDSPVRTFSPVADGFYIGTEKAVHWFEGLDPTTTLRRQVASYGAVRGTECEIPGHYFGRDEVQGVVQTIFTTHGACACLDRGVFKNLTGSRYFPEAASVGASLLKIRGGTPLLTTTLFKEQ